MTSARLTGRPRWRSLLLAPAAIIATHLGGCATAVWYPRVESVSGGYRNTSALSKVAEQMPEGGAEDVRALIDEVPPGIEIKDGVLTADPSRYEVLGRVAAKPAGEFFYPYKEGWRRVLCYPQRVLTVATGYLWVIVPTVWPCFVASGSVEDRRDRIVEALKRATKAMGGNLLLVSGFGGTMTVHVRHGSGASTGSVSTMEATEGVGWAVKAKQAAPVARSELR